jgi:hypothetical protein
MPKLRNLRESQPCKVESYILLREEKEYLVP